MVSSSFTVILMFVIGIVLPLSILSYVALALFSFLCLYFYITSKKSLRKIKKLIGQIITGVVAGLVVILFPYFPKTINIPTMLDAIILLIIVLMLLYFIFEYS